MLTALPCCRRKIRYVCGGRGRLGITMASQKNSRKKESNNEHLYLKKYLFSLEHNYTVSTKTIRIVTHTHT